MSFPSEDGYDHAGVALAERRQRAREAGQDTIGTRQHGIDVAVETATRVRVDNELMAASAASGLVPAGMPREQQRRALTAIFRAAGFEVEQ